MLERLLRFSVAHRWFVVLATIALAAIGAHSLLGLPIDAIPDITNRQVVINTLDASLSPTEVEKQVTFVVETALAGIPGLSYTRSLSRNGFSQVTAVFADDVDIYFARQQVLERLGAARESLPATAEPVLGPITTGLGEIYMWTVEYETTEAGAKNAGPSPKPVLLPNFSATASATKMAAMAFTPGTRNKTNHQVGLPAMRSSTTRL